MARLLLDMIGQENSAKADAVEIRVACLRFVHKNDFVPFFLSLTKKIVNALLLVFFPRFVFHSG